MSRIVQTFQDLEVYQRAIELDFDIFMLSKKWPVEEKYALTDQMRRSSRSIGACLAEAWAKRRYPAHFASKLSDADAELQESIHWISRAAAYGYLNETERKSLLDQCLEIGRMLGAMMKQAGNFGKRSRSDS